MYLQNCNISDITELQYLINLKSLYVPFNKIKNLSVLSNLINLQELDITENDVSHLPDMSRLIKLEILYIGHNEITSLVKLNNLNIKQLYCHSNKIHSFKHIKSLKYLTRLNIGENKFKNINN